MIYAIADVQHIDYDNYDMLNKLFNAIMPHGWRVSIWKKGELPSLYKKEKHGNICKIFVDYNSTAMRQHPGDPVLSYRCYDAEDILIFREDFDNVDKLIIYLTGKV